MLSLEDTHCLLLLLLFLLLLLAYSKGTYFGQTEVTFPLSFQCYASNDYVRILSLMGILRLSTIGYLEFKNEAWSSLGQLNGGCGAPPTFHLDPSVLSIPLDKSVRWELFLPESEYIKISGSGIGIHLDNRNTIFFRFDGIGIHLF